MAGTGAVSKEKGGLSLDFERDTIHLDRRDLSADHVEAAWTHLLQAAEQHEQSGLVRTHTLIVLTAARQPTPEVEPIAARHPGRYITVVVGSGSRRSAEVTLLRAPGRPVASELVELPLPSRDTGYWAEAVLPLLRADMPVACLVRDLDLLEGDEFLHLAENLDIAILDTRSVERPTDAWGKVLLENPDLTPMDLAWTALQPWREVAAAAFDPEDLFRLLPSLKRVEAVGGPLADSAALWFQGWLIDRVGCQKDELPLIFTARRAKGGLRSLALAFEGGHVCRIELQGRQLRAEVDVHGRTVHTAHQAWTEPDWASLVCTSLERGYDAVFRNTVRNLVEGCDVKEAAGRDV
jgi:glucose-6-phosphate dehydrogenase assembly protein OpcA